VPLPLRTDARTRGGSRRRWGGPQGAPSEGWKGPAPSEERPARGQELGHSVEDCGEVSKALPAEQAESMEEAESTEK
jgi:hypothetical protein